MPSARHAMVGLVLSAAVAAASCEPSIPTEQSRPTVLVATQSVAPDGPGLQHFVAHLTGASEVPAHATRAVGEVKFQLSPDGSQLDYRLISSNIQNGIASHIHLAPAGVNGPTPTFLFGTLPPGGRPPDPAARPGP